MTGKREDATGAAFGLGNQYLVRSTPYATIRCAAIATLIWLLSPCASQAQTLLRWKLKPGDSLAIQTKQEIQSQVAFSGKSATTKIDLDVRLTWRVTAADDSQINLKQTIDQIQIKLATPQGGAIDFDSKAKARPAGQARELAGALEPLVGAEFDLVMNRRGEISEALPANDAAKALFSAANKVGNSDSTRAAVEQLLHKPLIVLPADPVKTDDRWTAMTDLKTAAGPLQQETKYHLAGTTEQDGKPLQKIEMSAKLVPLTADAAPLPNAKMTVKTFEQAGTILFSAAEGRVVQSEQTQRLVTERSYRDTTIVVTLTSNRRTTVEPER